MKERISKWISINLNPYQNYLYYTKTKPFLIKLDKCNLIQEDLLFSIIEKNKYSKFGIDYNFKKIKTLKDFKKNIPILNYENLKEYITDSIKGMNNSINSEKIVYYAITSGTTSEPKFLPHTLNYIKLRKKAWQIWINQLFKSKPKAFSPFGSILTFTAKPFDGITDTNTMYGSISGQIHNMQPSFIKLLYGAPDEILLIDNFELKYYLIILFSIRKNITLIVTPNPSTLIIYSKKINKYYYQLLTDLNNNSIEMLEKNENIQKEIKKKLLKKFKNKRINKKTAKKLKKLKYQNSIILPKHIFPNLQAIGCWRGGSVGTYVKKLPYYFGKDIEIRDIGYMASEGRFTIPTITKIKGDSILDIESNFYEFIEIKDFDKGIKKTKLAHETQIGKKYFIIITNENGLYRYFIDDIIEVTGFNKNTPLIRFVQKGKYFSSITGEKISEWEILDSIYHTHKELKFDYHTFFVIANTSKEIPFYEYHIDFDKKYTKKEIKEIEKLLEKKLQKLNIEYKEKRESQRLNSIKVKELPKNSLHKIKLGFSKNKNSDTQVKVPKLIVLEKDKEILKELKLI